MMKDTEVWFKSLRQGNRPQLQTPGQRRVATLSKSMPELPKDIDMEFVHENQHRRRKAYLERVIAALSEQKRQQQALLLRRKQRAQSVECFLRQPIREIERSQRFSSNVAEEPFYRHKDKCYNMEHLGERTDRGPPEIDNWNMQQSGPSDGRRAKTSVLKKTSYHLPRVSLSEKCYEIRDGNSTSSASINKSSAKYSKYSKQSICNDQMSKGKYFEHASDQRGVRLLEIKGCSKSCSSFEATNSVGPSQTYPRSILNKSPIRSDKICNFSRSRSADETEKFGVISQCATSSNAFDNVRSELQLTRPTSSKKPDERSHITEADTVLPRNIYGVKFPVSNYTHDAQNVHDHSKSAAQMNAKNSTFYKSRDTTTLKNNHFNDVESFLYPNEGFSESKQVCRKAANENYKIGRLRKKFQRQSMESEEKPASTAYFLDLNTMKCSKNMLENTSKSYTSFRGNNTLDLRIKHSQKNRARGNCCSVDSNCTLGNRICSSDQQSNNKYLPTSDSKHQENGRAHREKRNPHRAPCQSLFRVKSSHEKTNLQVASLQSGYQPEPSKLSSRNTCVDFSNKNRPQFREINRLCNHSPVVQSRERSRTNTFSNSSNQRTPKHLTFLDACNCDGTAVINPHKTQLEKSKMIFRGTGEPNSSLPPCLKKFQPRKNAIMNHVRYSSDEKFPSHTESYDDTERTEFPTMEISVSLTAK